MLLVLLAVLAADDPSASGEVEPTLVGVDDSNGCILVSNGFLETLDGVVRGDFETMVRLVDEEAGKRFDDVEGKPYKRTELIKELAGDRQLAKKIQVARKHLAAATYCLEIDAANDGKVEFLAGSFRLGMGNMLTSDKLSAAVVKGNPDNGKALTVGTWKRVECWAEDERYIKPCGPVFRDMPKALKAVLEDGSVQVRWRWRGLPKTATGFLLVPWRGAFAKQKTDLLALDNPTVEFFDSEKVLWTAK